MSAVELQISPQEAAALHHAILAAHAQHDLAQLVELYAIAADGKEAEGDTDAACFFLTQAFVFALEAGVARAQELNHRLVAYGRAWPLEQ
ncbi:hypothetical protein [Tritonibacter mobilis]|jgi:hypothetical protein|uniref:hypothetical protein n=1 Tax=Tritonibacter mobilis TaxID=379347 RepID=UPI003A5BEDF5